MHSLSLLIQQGLLLPLQKEISLSVSTDVLICRDGKPENNCLPIRFLLFVLFQRIPSGFIHTIMSYCQDYITKIQHCISYIITVTPTDHWGVYGLGFLVFFLFKELSYSKPTLYFYLLTKSDLAAQAVNPVMHASAWNLQLFLSALQLSFLLPARIRTTVAI